MRRPLVLAGVLFLVILFLALQIEPLWWGEQAELPEQTVLVRGRISDKEYKYSDGKFMLILYLDKCELVSLNAACSYELMCYLDLKTDSFSELIAFEESRGEKLLLGEWVNLSGKVKAFENATNKGQFDACKYYQISGIGGRLYSCKLQNNELETDSKMMSESASTAKIKVKTSLVEKWNCFRNILHKKKRYVMLLLYATMDERDASVMSSLMLGQKALLDSEVKDIYKQSGIIHILAISGLHISLFGMSTFQILRKMHVPTFLSGLFSLIFVIIYGFMVGFGPSSMRAIIMFVMQMLAYLIGRTYDLLSGLCLAAVVLLFMQPLYLYHSGFILSFASVASMALLMPAFENLFCDKIRPGLAILLGTLPVHGLFYYQIAPYALFLNLLVVPCVGILLVLGIIVFAVGSLSLRLASFPASVVSLILQLFEGMSSFTLHLSNAKWIIGKPAFLQVFLYLTILVITCLLAKKMPEIWCYLQLLLAIGILCRNWQWGLQVSFLDVGQGDGIYVTDHRGTHVLIDGGSSSAKQVGQYRILPYLKSEGVSELDAVFISHLDEDHYNGILELIELSDEEGIGVDVIYYTGLVAEEESDKVRELYELAEKHSIRIDTLTAGKIYKRGQLSLECIYPKESESFSASNENSMVLLLQYGSFKGLFTGDLEGSGEKRVEEIIGKRNYGGIDFLKVAHHGSKNSSASSFLKSLQPKISIISAGKNNSYGHPHDECLFRIENVGSSIFRTDEGGAVSLQVKGNKMTIDSYCSSQVLCVK